MRNPSLILHAISIWSATAWSFAPIGNRLPHKSCRSLLNHLFATSISSEANPYANLSSAYDKALPSSMVGEAVRAALRSNRGICFDFTKNQYSDNGSQGRLVSVVEIRGKGTRSFLNAKFSQSVPKHAHDCNGTILRAMELIQSGTAYETGYLTSKGRIIDRILIVAFLSEAENDEDKALLITSPGNSGSRLYDELAPLVFPMDQVTLTDCSSSTTEAETSVLTIACSKLKDVQTSFNNNVAEFLDGQTQFDFPPRGVCNQYKAKGTDVYILEHTFLSTVACHGYTLILQGDGSLANQIWSHMNLYENDQGPVGVGSLEYETLRIEAGIPGYGFEMMGDGPKRKKSATDSEGRDVVETNEEQYFSKASPIELHQHYLVDTEKGCYQGQEGVASMMKNTRGSPRILYQIVFYDAENTFDDDGIDGSFLMSINTDEIREFQQRKKLSTSSNDTRQPRPGDSLFVLGSNESILVGTITSVAEPNGTGDSTTVALALVRRADSILKGIKEQGLEMPKWWENPNLIEDDSIDMYGARLSRDDGTSGLMNPPPLDPLVNLEVTIGGTYTVGRLQSIPSRRYQNTEGDVASLLDYEGRGEVVATSPGEISYTEPEIKIVKDGSDEKQRVIDVKLGEDDPILNDIAEAEKEAEEAAIQAEKAAAEARRKAEKIEMLKAKAEAAMAARRKKKESS